MERGVDYTIGLLLLLQRIVNALSSVKTNGSSRLDRALVEAFRVLHIVSKSHYRYFAVEVFLLLYSLSAAQ